MEKRMLIVGGLGFVGSNVSMLAKKKGYQVIIGDSSASKQLSAFQQVVFDITDEEEVKKQIDTLRPNVILNTAAMSNIDKAEKDQEQTYAVNVTGAHNLAKAAKAQQAKYLFISSDAVFDGKHYPFSENSKVDPVNYYGKTKAMAESAVLDACPSSAIARLSLVLGASVTPSNSFIMGFIEKLKKGDEIPTPSIEVRTPVDVYTLSACLLEMIEKDVTGVMHLGSTESGSKFYISQKIAEKLGYNPDIVKESNQSKPGRAPRHLMGVLDVSKAKQNLDSGLLNLDETIDKALSEIMLKNP